jgi:DNA-binding XRE family transcriptional regulator
MSNRTTKKETLGQEVTFAQFLQLSPEEEALTRIRLALHRKLKQSREKAHLTQDEVARRIGSSQSRIAKAESGNVSVSIELLMKAMLATGATPREIGATISQAAEELLEA